GSDRCWITLRVGLGKSRQARCARWASPRRNGWLRFQTCRPSAKPCLAPRPITSASPMACSQDNLVLEKARRGRQLMEEGSTARFSRGGEGGGRRQRRG